jgi:hypothetical protein
LKLAVIITMSNSFTTVLQEIADSNPIIGRSLFRLRPYTTPAWRMAAAFQLAHHQHPSVKEQPPHEEAHDAL